MSTPHVPRGMRDIMYPLSLQWERLMTDHSAQAAAYGYVAIEPPMVESTELFVRGVGTGTDVVDKEMYTLTDLKGRSLTLRPEGTAGVLRAVLSNTDSSLPKPFRVRYGGPMFRYGRPQAGRYRQFYQVGVEAIGDPAPYLDVEIIDLAYHFLTARLGEAVSLQLNSIGTLEDRERYRGALVEYYTPIASKLCGDCQRRLESNPLRLLDCKEDARWRGEAPLIGDHLSSESSAHIAAVRDGLDQLKIPHTSNPYLVRGLDYYCHTVFEFWHESLAGAQNALGGGGRYDGLAEVLGFPKTAGIGYSLGVDRILIVEEEDRQAAQADTSNVVVDAYVAAIGGSKGDGLDKVARQCATFARGCGVPTILDLSHRKIDATIKSAVALGATTLMLVGDDEAQGDEVTVRDLTTRVQKRMALTQLENYFRDR